VRFLSFEVPSVAPERDDRVTGWGRSQVRFDQALAVLGLTDRASAQEITAAYRKLVRLYHPDRHHGAADAVRAEAERRMLELNAARRALKTHHRSPDHLNWERRRPAAAAPHVHALATGTTYSFESRAGSRDWMIVGGDGRDVGEVREVGERQRPGVPQLGYRSFEVLAETRQKVLDLTILRPRMLPMLKVSDLILERTIATVTKRSPQEFHVEHRQEQIATVVEEPEVAAGAFLVRDPGGDLIARLTSRREGARADVLLDMSPDAELQLRLSLLAAPVLMEL